jgi:translation initiation factor 4G
MTSVSSQAQLPTQASNTTSAQSTPSYASTAKKAVSSPPIATGSSTPSPAVAVGGSAPVQHHGKTNSISPVNGKPSISPAVPVISAPAIAHSSSAMNGGGSTDHTRKTSVTINANGPSSINGGPVGGSKSIQFGAMGGASPAASPAHPAASAPMPIPNPRVTDPSHSPTPIPAPSASGGRPPSIAGQGNGLAFGSFGGDGDVSLSFAFAPNLD